MTALRSAAGTDRVPSTTANAIPDPGEADMGGGRISAILAASDLGPTSDEVVRTAAMLAEVLGAELHLLNALEIDRLPALEAPIYPERVEQARDLLAEQAFRMAPGLDPANVLVVDHAADKAILTRAAEVGAGLIVVGPHGGGAARARLLGTTAETLIRGAEVPVLVVRGHLRLPVRRIGVPTDFSTPSCGALDVALRLARPLGGEAEIRLFHVGWPPEGMDGPTPVDRSPGLTLLSHAEEAAARAGESSRLVRTELVWGISPTDSISEHAREEEMALLVIGTRGRGWVERLLVGSVAAGVARQAHCPVLLVPPRFGES